MSKRWFNGRGTGKREETTATREAASSMGLRTTASCHCHKKRREVEYQFFSSSLL